MTADRRSSERLGPMRTCVGCGRIALKSSFVRVVRAPDGSVSVDGCMSSPGRGAYICRSAECVAAARKKRGAARSLKCRVGDEIYDELMQVCHDG